MSADAIDAPEDIEPSQTMSENEDNAGPTRTIRNGYRAPFVTGSFNHAVLPMPPVRPSPPVGHLIIG